MDPYDFQQQLSQQTGSVTYSRTLAGSWRRQASSIPATPRLWGASLHGSQAYTLVELLVVTAILAVLVGLLIPALQQVRVAAQRTRGLNTMHQLGIAAMNYASAHEEALPPARTIEDGLVRWWFAMTTPTGKPIDVTSGHLMPFLENSDALFRNPAKTPGRVYLIHDGTTGGFGYNYRYLAPLETMPDGTERWVRIRVAQVGSSSATLLFVTSAKVSRAVLPTGSPCLVETGLAEPPSQRSPSVHFRHSGRTAHVVFVDGHAEVRTDRTRNPAHPADPPEILHLRDEENLYDIGTDDTLWDRD